MERIAAWNAFGGRQWAVRHPSAATRTLMEVSVFVPPQAAKDPVPCVVYLSGLSCTWENVTTKAGFQRAASELGLAIVCPDTSPRGEGVADADGYDLGQGASFYLDATRSPWAEHYQMERYIVEDLLALVSTEFPIDAGRVGIMGHSMGGHGALTLGMRHRERFASVSAVAPIVAPSAVPWGKKAFSAYLGEDPNAWAEYDACALVQARRRPGTLLVDQGTADKFYSEQLQTWRLEEAAKASGQAVRVRLHDGYDHSYYFVATFIEDHLRHHGATLLR